MTKPLIFFVVLSCSLSATSVAAPAQREVKTPYYSLTLTPDGEGIAALSVDSLGKGEFRPSGLFPPEAKASAQAASQGESPVNTSSDWQFKFSSQSFEMYGTAEGVWCA